VPQREKHLKVEDIYKLNKEEDLKDLREKDI
jgi:hypothetical protein